MVNGWKIVAIIFIILFLLENIFIYWGITLVNNEEDKKMKCSNEICYNLNADSFVYDNQDRICRCYSEEKIIHQEVLT